MRNRVAPIVCWSAILGLLLVGVTKLGDARQTSVATSAAPQKTIEYVEWKRSDPPVWLESARDDIDMEAVRANLATPVKMRCENKPFGQALKLLDAQIKTNIIINEIELGIIGIDVETPITFEGSGKLKDVLQLLLAQLHTEDGGVTWRVVPSGFLVTSIEDADAVPELRTFDLTYFLPDASHANELMSLITMHIDPDTWLAVGGTNVISHFGSQLVVSAPSTTMSRIETLLAHVSKQDREHLKAPKYKEDNREPKEPSAAPSEAK